MKNVFWVINKEKLYAYVVSLITIVILFCMSFTMNSDILTKETMAEYENSSNLENKEKEDNVNERKSSLGENALVSNENYLDERFSR